MQVTLNGLRTGSGKNNDFGIGARLELRAGTILQTRVVTSRVTHFGLGPHLKADVLRIEWPNGVPQTVFFPGTDQDVLELEALKGSCAFVYTWDGKRFRFVTDVMWRSALGMPVGIMAANGAGGGMQYAPAGASHRVPAHSRRRAPAARRALPLAAHGRAVGDGLHRRDQAAGGGSSGLGRRLRRREVRPAGTDRAPAAPGRWGARPPLGGGRSRARRAPRAPRARRSLRRRLHRHASIRAWWNRTTS